MADERASFGPPVPAPVAAGAYKPLDRYVQAVVIVLAAVAVFDLLAIVSDALELHLLGSIQAGGQRVSVADVQAADSRQSLISSLQALLYLTAAVLWMRWFHRAYENLSAVGATRRFGTGWAIGSWFMPFVSLWRPKQIADELWHAGGDGQAEAPPLMRWWWGGFLLTGSLGNLAFKTLVRDDSLTALKTSTSFSLVSDMIEIGAAVLAVLVARRITDRLDARARAPRRTV